MVFPEIICGNSLTGNNKVITSSFQVKDSIGPLRKMTNITKEDLLALQTSCGEVLKPNQVRPHLLCPYGMDHFQSSSKASLLDELKEEREGQLGTHADTLQTHSVSPACH